MNDDLERMLFKALYRCIRQGVDGAVFDREIAEWFENYYRNLPEEERGDHGYQEKIESVISKMKQVFP